MITKNIDSTDLIVASVKTPFSKQGYIHGGDDPLLKKPIEEIAEKDGQVYDNKDLEINIGGDGRKWDVDTFNQTAKDGAAGAIGKALSDKDKTLKSEEKDMKEEIHRAYRQEFLKYLVRKGKI